MDSFTTLRLTLLCCIVSFFSVRWIARRRRRYLPGPSGWPVIGNLLQIPVTDSWEVYMKWRKLYGDAIYLNAAGSSIVVLNTYEACADLMEKRSDIYSDKPRSILCTEMLGWNRTLTMAPYGDHWKQARRLAAQTLRKEAVKKYRDAQENGVVMYLTSLLQEPENFVDNIRFAMGHSLVKSIYGVDIESPSDPIILAVEGAADYALQAVAPGNFLVDFFPFLQYIPEWVPGTGWKKFAARGRELCDQMADLAFDKTLAEMASGSYDSSFTSINLENEEDPYVVKWSAGTMYVGGTNTTVGVIHNFILAMVLHPELQRKAQIEIDSITGGERLPAMSDRENMPYVNSLIKEILRWLPPMPLAVPHRLSQDDVYNDMLSSYFIPQGAMVFGNVWAISRDESIYENPEAFNPDRFMPLFNKSIPPGPLGLPLDPEKYVFGFGRRTCVGIHYAETMLFLIISNVLACFDISPIKGKDGKNILPKMEFVSSMIREPVPFQCSITIRSPAARSLIETHSI